MNTLIGRVRTFYSSRWERRLSKLLEHKRYPPPPKIPDNEIYVPVDKANGNVDHSNGNGSSKGYRNTDNSGSDSSSSSDGTCNTIEYDPSNLKSIRAIWSSRRCGVLAYKIGSMHIWDVWGERHPCTVLQVDRCVVLEQRRLDTHGYEALQLGLGYKEIERISKPNLGRYIKIGTGPKHVVKEMKCSGDCFLPVGHVMSVRHFVPGQWVFISGWTKAKGYQGVVKRHGFGGQTQSHGSHRQRSTGSIGQGHSVNLVWKFKKMSGHVGPDPRCVNGKVMRIESSRNLMYIRGCVPGHVGSVVKVSDGRGKTWRKNKGISLPYPTFVPDKNIICPNTVDALPSETDPFLYPELQMNYD